MPLSTKERKLLTFEPLEKLVAVAASLPRQEMGKYQGFFLDEISRRFELAIHKVALAIITSEKGDSGATHRAYVWSRYDENRNERFRSEPKRRFNSTTRSNDFQLAGEQDDNFLSLLADQFDKAVIVGTNGLTVLDGHPERPLGRKLEYGLSIEPYTVSLANVVNEYRKRRPSDQPITVAVHSEWDNRFRTLFETGVPIKNFPDLSNMTFATRHGLLGFRFSLGEREPIYLIYSVPEAKVIDMTYGFSKKTNMWLSKLKEAQRTLEHPLVEVGGASVNLPRPRLGVSNKPPIQ